MKTLATLFAVFFLLGNVNAQEGKSSAPVADSAVRTVSAKVDTTKYDRVFTRVEKEAAFPGGAKGWSKFLDLNLDPRAAEFSNLNPGSYPVYVRFLVDTNGVVSDIHAFEKVSKCPRCVADVQKIMKKSPKWVPAFQGGRHVKYLCNQRITYTVTDF